MLHSPRQFVVVILLAAACLPMACRKQDRSASHEQADNMSAVDAGERPAIERTAWVTAPAFAAAWRQSFPLVARLASMHDPAARRHMARQFVQALASANAELAKDRNTHLRAGDRALACGMNSIAADCFQRAVKLDPNDRDALKGLSVALTLAGRHEQALGVYRKLVALEPQDTTARFNLAVTLSQLGHYQEAQDHYTRLLTTNPDDFQSAFNLAMLYQAQGKLGEAKGAWAKAMGNAGEMSPSDAAAGWSSYGEVLIDLHEPEAAMKAYAACVKLDPDDADAWLNLSTASRAAGHLGHAVVAAQRCVKLAPKAAPAWTQLGELLLELHRQSGKREHLQQAIDAWQESLTIEADQPRIRQLLKNAQEMLPATNPATQSQPATEPEGEDK